MKEKLTDPTNAEWVLPSQNQWKAMFRANGGNEGYFSGLNTTIGDAGGTNFKTNDYYWTSDETVEYEDIYDDETGDVIGSEEVFKGGAFNFNGYTGSAYYLTNPKGNKWNVRACLAF